MNIFLTLTDYNILYYEIEMSKRYTFFFTSEATSYKISQPVNLN